MQIIYDQIGEKTLSLSLPSENTPVMPGIRWGNAGALFSPAFWKAQLWYAENRNKLAYLDYATGESLHEEVAACLLGGHGISSELAQAAFHCLRGSGFLVPKRRPSIVVLERALRKPMRPLGAMRSIHYRFPVVKAKYLSSALQRLDDECPPVEPSAFRNWLQTFEGIGWKTASWITRNWMHSRTVAVIDIHVFRAGVIANLFEGTESSISRRYESLEHLFLKFAAALEVDTRQLDVLIWRTMKDAENLGLRIFRNSCGKMQSAA